MIKENVKNNQISESDNIKAKELLWYIIFFKYIYYILL